MNNNSDEKYFTLKDIKTKFHIPQVTVRYWIKQGWLVSHKGINKYRKNVVYIKESDWLDFPSFIRRRYQ